MITALKRWYLDWSTRDDRALDRIFEGRSLLSDDEFYHVTAGVKCRHARRG